MPRAKRDPAPRKPSPYEGAGSAAGNPVVTRAPAARKPSPYGGAGPAAVNAVVTRPAPAVLGLLADGVLRSRPVIVAALVGRHARDDVVHTLIRLAVTGRVVETGGRYILVAS